MELRTNRLILREFVEADHLALAAWRSDPRYQRYYAFSEADPADALHFVRMLIDWRDQSPRKRYQLAVTLRESGKVIGCAGVRLGSEPDLADFGCEIDPRQWRHGFAVEAGQSLLDFAFNVLGVYRVSADVVAANSAAVALALALGMVEESRGENGEHKTITLAVTGPYSYRQNPGE